MTKRKIRGLDVSMPPLFGSKGNGKTVLGGNLACGAFKGWQGVFDARPETARRLTNLGRADARKAFNAGWRAFQ